MTFFKYRAGLTEQERELIRGLRARGFAVAMFTPVDVGPPLNRGEVESAMVKAGKVVLKQKEVRSAHD